MIYTGHYTRMTILRWHVGQSRPRRDWQWTLLFLGNAAYFLNSHAKGVRPTKRMSYCLDADTTAAISGSEFRLVGKVCDELRNSSKIRNNPTPKCF